MLFKSNTNTHYENNTVKIKLLFQFIDRLTTNKQNRRKIQNIAEI